MSADGVETFDVAVLGAGIAGAVAARRLHDEGARVVVLDKARGVGGRMATRRVGDAVFDHGAQFFTTPGELLTEMVGEWQQAGAVEQWFDGRLLASGGTEADGHPRWRGTGGMTSVAKHLLAPVTVHTGARVGAVSLDDTRGTWALAVDGGRSWRADRLLATPPVPQTLELLDAGRVPLHPDDRAALAAVAYHPCLALLAVLDTDPGVPEPGIVRLGGEPVDVVADNRRKGISPIPALTVHAGPETSAALWAAADEAVVRRLLEGLPGPLSQLRPASVQVQRWRYARPVTVRPEAYVELRGLPPAFLAGDVFAGPLVGGAARSGWAAAGALLDRGSLT